MISCVRMELRHSQSYKDKKDFYLPFLEIQNEELGRKRKVGSRGERVMTTERESEGESQEPSCPAGLESNCPDGQDDRVRREQGLSKK